MFAEGYIIVC